jgi:hypothetical protein
MCNSQSQGSTPACFSEPAGTIVKVATGLKAMFQSSTPQHRRQLLGLLKQPLSPVLVEGLVAHNTRAEAEAWLNSLPPQDYFQVTKALVSLSGEGDRCWAARFVCLVACSCGVAPKGFWR